jgi:peroxiredoxin
MMRSNLEDPTMLDTRIGRLTILLLLLSIGLVGFSLNTRITTAQDPTAEDELESGKTLFRQRRYEEALKTFKRANEMREKKCAECYGWLSETYLALEAYKNVLESSDKVIEFAAGDKQLLVKAYNNKGLALQAQADKKDQKKLQGAETVFRQALALDNERPIIHYNLGVVLMQLNRDPEGGVEIKQYIQMQPRGNFADMARRLVENPRRARENFAPDFSFTSLQGEYISLDDLKGKVVLLDFWGTWCPPCVESVPELRNLHKRYSKDSAFVLIGISSDRDDEVWKDFTDKNRMIWPQYRDGNRKIQNAFNIRAYPTYIVIDHEGIVRYQSTGFGYGRAADLESAIKKYIKNAAQSAEAR